MTTFICYYFSHDCDDVKTVEVIAFNRSDAIDEFQSTHPHDMLVSMDEIYHGVEKERPAFYHGVDRYGNAGLFEDFEQSIGE